MNHGAGWEFRFTLEGRWRGGRHWSLKGAAGSGCAGLGIWQVVMCRRCPRCGVFHAKVAAPETRMINRIFLRCLHNKTYHTILSLRRRFGVKIQLRPALPTRWSGTGDRSSLWSWQGGFFRVRLLRGLGVAVPCRGRSHEEERWKASPYFHRKVGPYDVHTISIQWGVLWPIYYSSANMKFLSGSRNFHNS